MDRATQTDKDQDSVRAKLREELMAEMEQEMEAEIARRVEEELRVREEGSPERYKAGYGILKGPPPPLPPPMEPEEFEKLPLMDKKMYMWTVSRAIQGGALRALRGDIETKKKYMVLQGMFGELLRRNTMRLSLHG
ncbi:hypothetical protein KIPB_007074 [Kipferlia bialata]|uniref:Uncharacterized protein n=1 Tax=Kipferlia bialata TaxID=797122 RepID=A0A9K3CXZ3_9EUKA|nr:hypothetical protein KIPB_007074 [Kipferlia bialata]|eukprot:g7074.t1